MASFPSLSKLEQLPAEIRLNIYDKMADNGPAIIVDDKFIAPVDFLYTNRTLYDEYKVECFKTLPRHYTSTARFEIEDDGDHRRRFEVDFRCPRPAGKKFVLRIRIEVDVILRSTTHGDLCEEEYEFDYDWEHNDMFARALCCLGDVEELAIEMEAYGSGYAETTMIAPYDRKSFWMHVVNSIIITTIPRLRSLSEYTIRGDSYLSFDQGCNHSMHAKKEANGIWLHWPVDPRDHCYAMNDFLQSMGIDDEQRDGKVPNIEWNEETSSHWVQNPDVKDDEEDEDSEVEDDDDDEEDEDNEVEDDGDDDEENELDEDGDEDEDTRNDGEEGKEDDGGTDNFEP